MYNNNSNQINTIDFGTLPVRKTFTNGKVVGEVELNNGSYATIKLDENTNQPFAVIEEE